MARREGRSLATTFAFWDASALVPLCVEQSITPNVATPYKNYRIVVWWATPVEIASALARLVRTREISSSEWARARQVAVALADEWSVVQPSNSLRNRAAQLVEQYDLKAADAMQLAAALDWCENSPRGEVFLTADEKLRQAAVLSGFDASSLHY
jgi:predicted nucleic acid-binding protein